jgi:acyl CoA:acetate/3-ketoacid CoA transferase
MTQEEVDQKFFKVLGLKGLSPEIDKVFDKVVLSKYMLMSARNQALINPNPIMAYITGVGVGMELWRELGAVQLEMKLDKR